MKIVNVIGGLGNQMFQYAFAVALKHHFPDEEVLIDTQHFHYVFIKRIKAANLHNGYELKKLFPNATLPIASWQQLLKVSYFIPNYLLSRIARRILPVRKTEVISSTDYSQVYDPNVFQLQGDRYYEGYWQAVSYYQSIRHELLRIFKHGVPNDYNQTLIQNMERENSVGIHIRRGDYLQAPAFSGICDTKYYEKSIELILRDHKDHHFYIFSNDMPWCRQHITPLLRENEITYVTQNTGSDSCWDMFLMTHCKDLIIANSSFSWWGAFLNTQGGRIIAPYPWMNKNAEMDVYAPEWIKMNND